MRTYSNVSAAGHYTHTLEFVTMSVLRMFKEYYNESLNLDEQVGMFERIFLVTKFRTLTESEKDVINKSIEQK